MPILPDDDRFILAICRGLYSFERTANVQTNTFASMHRATFEVRKRPDADTEGFDVPTILEVYSKLVNGFMCEFLMSVAMAPLAYIPGTKSVQIITDEDDDLDTFIMIEADFISDSMGPSTYDGPFTGKPVTEMRMISPGARAMITAQYYDFPTNVVRGVEIAISVDSNAENFPGFQSRGICYDGIYNAAIKNQVDNLYIRMLQLLGEENLKPLYKYKEYMEPAVTFRVNFGPNMFTCSITMWPFKVFDHEIRWGFQSTHPLQIAFSLATSTPNSYGLRPELRTSDAPLLVGTAWGGKLIPTVLLPNTVYVDGEIFISYNLMDTLDISENISFSNFISLNAAYPTRAPSEYVIKHTQCDPQTPNIDDIPETYGSSKTLKCREYYYGFLDHTYYIGIKCPIKDYPNAAGFVDLVFEEDLDLRQVLYKIEFTPENHDFLNIGTMLYSILPTTMGVDPSKLRILLSCYVALPRFRRYLVHFNLPEAKNSVSEDKKTEQGIIPKTSSAPKKRGGLLSPRLKKSPPRGKSNGV